MRLAVDQRHPEIDQGVAGQYALGQLTANAFLHRRYELPRHRSADDALGEFEAGPTCQWLDLHHADRILTMSAGLLDEAALHLDGTNEGLPEGGTHRLDIDLDVPVISQRREQLVHMG